MNYVKIYESLISDRITLWSARSEQKKQKIGYYERHHILPKCLGGNNNKQNLVYLTAREHFIAHWLLWKIHKSKQLAYAFILLSNRNSNNNQVKITSKMYDNIKNLRSQYYSGNNSPKGFKGKSHTTKAKQGMRESKIGKNNPMYGLGQLHPNSKRLGKLNPNFGLDPWKNPSVLKLPSAINMWNNRDILLDVWLSLDKPHWYKFGKIAINHFDCVNYIYIPHCFRNMVNWFNSLVVCERMPQ